MEKDGPLTRPRAGSPGGLAAPHPHPAPQEYCGELRRARARSGEKHSILIPKAPRRAPGVKVLKMRTLRRLGALGAAVRLLLAPKAWIGVSK